ncbi:MAG TPA: hypothetical protein VHZ78_02435 [Rhizomicrobium sp.]|jgi:hypothetical protein|nr:hypothetical protein [Rhizomicrobium sp.]
MKTNRPDLPFSPVIAAAARRRPRHFRLEKKSPKARNNYIAETDLSLGKSSSKPGAKTGNRNALKHGLHSARRIAHRRHIRHLRGDVQMLLGLLKSLLNGAGVSS